MAATAPENPEVRGTRPQLYLSSVQIVLDDLNSVKIGLSGDMLRGMGRRASRGGHAGRRRGPKFTGVGTEETARRILRAAVRLVEDRGLEALSLRTLAESPDLNVTRSAPLHYFGSTLGLLGAIAARAFQELTDRARAQRGRDSAGHGVPDEAGAWAPNPAERDRGAMARELAARPAARAHQLAHLSEDLSPRRAAEHPTGWRPGTRSLAESVVQLALAYAEFGLEHPHLYRAMHAAGLWKSVGEPGRRQRTTTERTRAKAKPWIDGAVAARDEALYELVDAVRDAQKAGELRPGPALEVAHLLTALVDGYLFQFLEAQVGAEWSTAQRLAYLRKLLELTLRGLATQPVRV